MTKTIPDEFLEEMAEKFRMLSDPTRLAILRALMVGERSVGQVVEETQRGQANVSKHLKLLADAGLVGRRKQGLQVIYNISDPLVEELCQLVCRRLLDTAHQDVRRKTKLLERMGQPAPLVETDVDHTP